MIAAAREHGVQLMTAYRLHFEGANLKAVRSRGARAHRRRLRPASSASRASSTPSSRCR